ncbi:MAG: S8 family serine peptidase [Alphaproteobacteria bacterium]|nr:S8 family serine peptidase [Alphaproteobacteria bacterium]
MRFLGKEYDGTGVTIAVIDSGVNAADPRLDGATVEGWSIELSATGHALLHPAFDDEHGHGTEIAAAVHRVAPKARLLAVKIMGNKLRTSAELMAAGIETAARNGAHVINLSLGTPNMGKALLLRDCCGQAFELGAVVLAAAHPRGERAYPADLPETVGVASDQKCPYGRVFFFDPERFPRKAWPSLTDKFLTNGFTEERNGVKSKYQGSGLATAHLSGMVACLRQAMPKAGSDEIVDRLKQRALTPLPEIGYV